MDELNAHSKAFEYLVISSEPAYNDVVRSIKLVEKFIIDNNLIVYGGTAIDYTLRLKGDKIYPDDMLKVPDLDFYSPENVKHSYQIADILYHAGFTNARAINALHMETMRVDATNYNHFIADISFRPKEVFDKLPYLTYNGIRVIHPLFQRIDLHSSLAFPYDNSPMEVIFQRWPKDVERFNKLDKYYPVIMPTNMTALRELKIPGDFTKMILCGFAAYALIYTYFSRSMREYGAEMPTDIISAEFQLTDDYATFDTLNQKIEIVHYNMYKGVEDLQGSNPKYFEPYINLIPERAECSVKNIDVVIYSTRHRLLSVNTVKIEDKTIRLVGIQYLLKFFISSYFVYETTPKIANTYLGRYVSLLKMIRIFENVIKDRSDAKDIALQSPLFLTNNVYGNDNINLAQEVALNRLYADLDKLEKFAVPYSYYPSKNIPAGRDHPTFDPEKVVFFRESGRELIPDNQNKI